MRPGCGQPMAPFGQVTSSAVTMRAESAAAAPTCRTRLALALAITSFGTSVTDEDGAVAAGAAVRGLGAGGSPAEVAHAEVRSQGTTETKRTERLIRNLLYHHPPLIAALNET